MSAHAGHVFRRSRWSHLRLISLGLAVQLSSCPGAPEEIVLSFSGYRALIATERGSRPCFDLGAPPIVHWSSPEAEGWTVEVTGPGGLVPAQVSAEVRGGRMVARTVIAADPGVGAGRIVVREYGRPVGTAEICWMLPPESLPPLAEAARLRGDEPDRAQQLLTTAAMEYPDSTRLWAEVELGKQSFRAGRSDDALRWWGRAESTAGRLGVLSEQSMRLRAMAFVELTRGRTAEGCAYLERAESIDQNTRDEVGLARDDYLRALVALNLRRYREAEDALRRSADRAWNAGSDTEWLRALELLAADLTTLGRAGEAISLFDGREAPPVTRPLDRAGYLANLGWTHFEGHRSGEPRADLEIAARGFAEARALFREHGAVQDWANQTGNLARAKLVSGDVSGASRLLDELSRAPSAELGVGRWDIPLLRAELEIERGQGGAVRAQLEELRAAALAEVGGPSEHAASALVLLADIERASGRSEDAIALYRRALDELRVLSLRTAVRAASRSFASTRRHARDAAVATLVHAGRVDDALELVEHEGSWLLDMIADAGRRPADQAVIDTYEGAVRARMAHDPLECRRLHPRHRAACEHGLEVSDRRVSDARDALFDGAGWLRSGDGARASGHHGRSRLRPGEALLVLTHVDRALVAFLQARGRRHPASVGQRAVVLDRPALAGALARLEGIEHLYVVSDDHREADALALAPDARGHPLAARVGLSWLPSPRLLDRREAPRAASGSEVGSRPSLVIADPSGTLPEAEREGTWVAGHLPNTALLRGAEATRAAVRARWSRLDVLHFAGHGRQTDPDPWSTRLELADGGFVGAEDVLLERPKIGLVALVGCGTGAGGGRGEIGLPEIFLVSGSSAVLSTSSEISDGEGRRFIELFYGFGGRDRPGEAYRRAVEALFRAGDRAWLSFRLWGLAAP